MQVGRQANIDQVDLGVGQQLAIVGVAFDLREIDMAPPRAEIALNRRPVSGELSLVTRRNCRDAGPFECTRSLKVRVAHEAKADNSNAEHLSLVPPQSEANKKRHGSMVGKSMPVKQQRPVARTPGEAPAYVHCIGQEMKCRNNPTMRANTPAF